LIVLIALLLVLNGYIHISCNCCNIQEQDCLLLEIGGLDLSEVYQMTSVKRICQVEICNTYDHKHQALDKSKPESGLIPTATDIAKVLFRVLSQDGIMISQSFFRTLMTSYTQEARIAIEKYSALSLLKGLAYDRHTEIEAIDAFLACLKMATEEFVKRPCRYHPA
jgi:glucosyl-3-phosphoglycerate synthase